MSHLFLQMGYHGWVILIDETELMGRLGKKARLNAYRNMAQFLLPEKCPESAFTIFALSASYTEDVIEGKHEYENLEAIYPDEPEPIKTVLDLLVRAPQLLPLTKDEVMRCSVKSRIFTAEPMDGRQIFPWPALRNPRSPEATFCAPRSGRP